VMTRFAVLRSMAQNPLATVVECLYSKHGPS
jgi:hypothetical protein